MQLFTTRKVIGLCLLLGLLPATGISLMTAAPSQAAAKGKKPAASKAKTRGPIDTVGPQVDKGLDVTGILANMESRLNVFWHLMAIGPSKYCEIHFFLTCDGRYANVSVWRSSGDPQYDRAAMGCIDQAGPYPMFEGTDRLPCIATFRTEPKGADVTVSMPGFMGDSSRVDREIAAKRTQQLNVIKIMKDRIVKAQQVLGADSPKLSESINFLANTYKEIKDYSSAEASYKWAISIRQKANGPNSKELAESYADLGDMYASKGDLVSAEDYYKRVINMPELKPCVPLRTAIQRYAKLCLQTRRPKDADFLYQRINDLQAGKALAPLPPSMVMDVTPAANGEAPGTDAAKSSDAAKPAESGKPESGKPESGKPESGKPTGSN